MDKYKKKRKIMDNLISFLKRSSKDANQIQRKKMKT